MLKDGKTYPFICIKKERFPRVFLTRKRLDDKSEYLGPYTSVATVKSILNFITDLYPLRTCNFNLSEKNIAAQKFKVCLEYHIGNCLGPCEGFQSEASYNESIDQIRRILKGHTAAVLTSFKEKMEIAAGELDFETADNYKGLYDKVKRFQARSTVVNPKINEVDVFGMADMEDRAFVSYFKLVEGAIIQTDLVTVKKTIVRRTGGSSAVRRLKPASPLPIHFIGNYCSFRDSIGGRRVGNYRSENWR